jgi:hypothetical protein
MKKCGKCKTYLEENEYSFRKGRLQSFCKECQKNYSKEYRQKYKKNCRKNLKEWREENSSDRKLTKQQVLQESFRSKMRRVLNAKNKDRIDKVFGYSSTDLINFLKKSFDKLPVKGYYISYKTPLSDFDLSNSEEWRKAGSFENLILKFKET